MAYGLTFFRDKIVVNQDFQKNINTLLQSSNVVQGSALLFAARDFKHDTGYTWKLPGYNLVLLADQYDANGGQIDVSGQPVPDGAPGSAGVAGVATGEGFNDRPGGRGDNGGDGTAGANGMKISLFCRQLLNAHLVSNGSTGGAGGKGGNGRLPSPHGTSAGYGGTDGGRGGDGGKGGAGGNGGQVTVIYVSGNPPILDAFGGAAGVGGATGSGGKKGGLALNDGVSGTSGKPGVKGSDGQRTSSQVDAQTFLNHLHADIDQATIASWSQYRLSVGEYFFRAFNPSGPPTSDYLPLALGEFDAVLQLQPQDAQATNYRNWLLNNQNTLGFPRDADILPDFPTYESVDTDYGPLILDVFQSVGNMIVLHADLDSKKQDLGNEIKSMDDLLHTLAVEKEATQIAADAGQADKTFADQQVTEIQQEINAQMQAMEAEKMDVDTTQGLVLFGVGVVAIAALTIATAGAAVAAVPAVIALGESVTDPKLLTKLMSGEKNA